MTTPYVKTSTPEQRIVVTGGASGIGLKIARYFLSRRAQVCVLDIDESALDAMSKDAPPNLSLLRCDVSDQGSVDSAFERITEDFGGLDTVVNNAGISERETFFETDLDTWNRIIKTNLTGVFLVSQSSAKLMLRQERGNIINISSVSGLIGMPEYLSYNVSKAGVIELTKTLAIELGPNIRVNAVCPGYVLTAMQMREYSQTMLDELGEMVPAKRLGRPEEIASAVGYLSSDDASFITGSILVIDGGEISGGLASRKREAESI